MKTNNLRNIQFFSSLCVLGGVGMKFGNISLGVYVFLIGVLGLFGLQILYAIKTKDAPLQVKRVAGLMFVATVILGLGAYFMFTDNGNWVVMVLIYALITFYLSFRNKK